MTPPTATRRTPHAPPHLSAKHVPPPAPSFALYTSSDEDDVWPLPALQSAAGKSLPPGLERDRPAPRRPGLRATLNGRYGAARDSAMLLGMLADEMGERGAAARRDLVIHWPRLAADLRAGAEHTGAAACAVAIACREAAGNGWGHVQVMAPSMIWAVAGSALSLARLPAQAGGALLGAALGQSALHCSVNWLAAWASWMRAEA